MEDAAPALDQVRILLVDDNTAVRTAMRRALADHGSQVVEASSGDAAIKLIEEAGPFDILVTDVRMPGIRDGVTFASDWQKHVPGRPVLLVTGDSDDRLSTDQPASNVAVLGKPFQRACLVSTVRRLLQGACRAA